MINFILCYIAGFMTAWVVSVIAWYRAEKKRGSL